MTRWQYKHAFASEAQEFLEELNRLGDAGWEVVTINGRLILQAMPIRLTPTDTSYSV